MKEYIDFELPFGKEKISFTLDKSELAGVLRSNINSYEPPYDKYTLVKKAMEAPIGTKTLTELAKGKKKVCLIASDHTRPVPSKIIVPLMLDEIRNGNPDADITILIATGLHRTTTKDELVYKFGEEIVKNEKIIIHDCDDTDNLVNMGKLPSGGDFVLNKIAKDADLLVSEGFIEPHFFAGFSGGRKSVLPGVCSRKTVMYNHNASFIANDHARTGVLENNPIHTDMLFAAKKANLAYIVNVVINAEHDPIFAVAGDAEMAHLEGVRFLSDKCRVKAQMADIVISTNGGYPMDQNIYQAVKGMTAAEATVNEGGVIIMLAKATDGHGGVNFYNTFKNCESVDALMERFLNTPPYETSIDQWQSQILARVMLKATVIFVSSCDDKIVENMRMIPAKTVCEAVEKARKIINKKDVRITVIPDGVSVIVEGESK
ncbi:MAG: nickel-dependent lactate racemase [Clostridia bacterium]|nr:nickel-dependent lactate racemase [Clostridia bacterium]